jgi:hypothetical protein
MRIDENISVYTKIITCYIYVGCHGIFHIVKINDNPKSGFLLKIIHHSTIVRSYNWT